MLRPPVTTADNCDPDTPALRIRCQFISAPSCTSQASGPADRPFSAFAGNSPGGHQPRRGLTGPHPPSVVASFSTLGGTDGKVIPGNPAGITRAALRGR